VTYFWAALNALTTLAGLVRDFFHWKENVDQRQAGIDAANASTQKQNAERVAEARKIEEEAEREHRFNPDDDSGLDQTFRRD
jgi:multidrug resistance efflux pump